MATEPFNDRLHHLLSRLSQLHQNNIDIIKTPLPPFEPSPASPHAHHSAVASILSILTLHSNRKGGKQSSLLRLQLHCAVTQKNEATTLLHRSRQETRALQLQVAALSSTKSLVAALNTKDLNAYRALEIKVRSLNHGFQGLNEACAEADQKSMTFALYVLSAMVRKWRHAVVGRAWQQWGRACHHASTARHSQHVKNIMQEQREQQQYQHDQQQKHIQRLHTELNNAKAKSSASASASAEAAASSAPGSEMTVVVEEHADRQAILNVVHTAREATTTVMQGMQHSLDAVSLRFQHLAKRMDVFKQVQRMRDTAATQHRQESTQQRKQHALAKVVTAQRFIRATLCSTFLKWHGATIAQRFKEHHSQHTQQIDLLEQDQIKVQVDEEDEESATQRMQREVDRLTTHNTALQREHDQEVQFLRSRAVASQQNFDQRILALQYQIKTEREDFAREKEHIQIQGRGREVAWRDTAMEATGSLDRAMHQMGTPNRRGERKF